MKTITKTIKKGFTLVELALALVFISIILLTIAWLTMHISASYQKGLAMKTVNATAKEIIDDMSRAIAQSPAITVSSLCSSKYTNATQKQKCIDDKARAFTYQQRYGTVRIAGNTETVPTGGVFCTGRYSYVWNTAYALNMADYPTTTGVSYAASFDGDTEFRLKKVTDYERKLCTQHLTANYGYDGWQSYTVTGLNPEINVEMLDAAENNLAIYDFAVFTPTIHSLTSAGFYSGTFILATLRGGININSYGEYCSDPPDGLDTDFAYCAINKFNFAMRAAGEKTTTER